MALSCARSSRPKRAAEGLRQTSMAGTLLETAFVSVKIANRPDELAPMAIFRRTPRRFRVAPFEPRPHALIVSVCETFGEIVGLFVEPGKKRADCLLVGVGHLMNDGPRGVNKQAWPC